MEATKKKSSRKPKSLNPDNESANPEDTSLEKCEGYSGGMRNVSQPEGLRTPWWSKKEVHEFNMSYLKFITFVKKINLVFGPNDLENITGPLFCHAYLELLKHDLSISPEEFFITHISSVDPSRCQKNVTKLIAAIEKNTCDRERLIQTFCRKKFTIRLKPLLYSMFQNMLKWCHILFVQILASWFQIEEICEEKKPEDDKQEKSVSVSVVDKFKSAKATVFLKKVSCDITTMQICDVKDNVTCGIIDFDHRKIVYCHNKSTYIRPFETMERFLLRQHCEEIVFRNHTGPIYDIDIVKKHNVLVTASADKNVCVYDLNSNRKRSILREHTSPVFSVSASSDGSHLATGSYDATIRLWSLQKNSTVHVYTGHENAITDLAFYPYLRHFASASTDKTVCVWSVSSEKPVSVFKGSKGPIHCVKFSPDGNLIASAGEDKLRVWDLLNCQQLVEMNCGRQPVTQICWSSDQNTITTGSTNGVVQQWNIPAAVAAEKDRQMPSFYYRLHAKIVNIEFSKNEFNCLSSV